MPTENFHKEKRDHQMMVLKIKRYWKDRGYTPSVWLEELSLLPGDQKKPERYCVIRSDMINGYPAGMKG